MRKLLAILLCTFAVQAGPLVLINYNATLTSVLLTDQLGNPADPSPYGPLPIVGGALTGTFVYDVAVNEDSTPSPVQGSYFGAPVSASISAGTFLSSFVADPLSPDSRVIFTNDLIVPGVSADGINLRTSHQSGGAYLGSFSRVVLNWRTSNLASINTDAMQVLPNGINFDIVARVFYQESNGIVDLELISVMNSYSVSIVDTPEPAAWSMLLIGAGLIAARKLKN